MTNAACSLAVSAKRDINVISSASNNNGINSLTGLDRIAALYVTRYTNAEVAAGKQVNITSGGDTTLKGAVVAANQIKADIGGSLSIESLQDTSTYTSQQQSLGGSISVGAGKVGGSFSASNSSTDSNFQSVNEQSGLKAGDGGFQVKVAGNTDFKGSVIASTDKAVTDGKNVFTTGGSLTTSDIQNTASYKGTGYSLGEGVGTGPDITGKTSITPGGSFGFGSAKGDAASTSSAGISGIAANTAVRTGDANTGLKPIFDAQKVQADINAQVAITAAFGQQASKAIGDYADTQLKLAAAKTLQASNETDPDKKAALQGEAKALTDNWGADGTIRV